MSMRAGEEQQCHSGGEHFSTHLLEDPADQGKVVEVLKLCLQTELLTLMRG